MIQLIYGSKGSGKTKKLIGDANAYAEVAKGSVVYITDNPLHARDVATAIRFVNATDYGIDCECCFGGFICGLIAGNHDIERIFIDRLSHLVKTTPDKLDSLLKTIDEISLRHQVDFVLSISCESLPDALAAYVNKAK